MSTMSVTLGLFLTSTYAQRRSSPCPRPRSGLGGYPALLQGGV